MAASIKLTVVERCFISPPQGSVPSVSLSLTFFDIPWLLFSPTQPLFFYNLRTSTAYFTRTLLPKLKQTLSLTLQHFFPLAGMLVTPSAVLSSEPHLDYAEHDAVSLTVAEASAATAAEMDACVFKNLVGNHRKIGRDFHGLVPLLMAAEGSKQPLLAIQITIFPETGICLGFTLRNVVADWRTFHNFLSAWASLARNGEMAGDVRHVASHDRSVMVSPGGLESTFLKEWWHLKDTYGGARDGSNDVMRASFVLGPKKMEIIKKWILTRSEILFGPSQLLLSPYVISCAFIWVCWMKTHWSTNDVYGGQNIHHLGFIAGGLTRLGYTVPSAYVGNCVGFGRGSAMRRELLGENGVVHAAKAIGDTIKKLNGDMMSGAHNWISDWKTIRESDHHIFVTGSPKLGLYELDFGWGRPVKFEEASIDCTGAISLSDSRDVNGGIEIGVALPTQKMDAFTTLFSEGLHQYFLCE